MASFSKNKLQQSQFSSTMGSRNEIDEVEVEAAAIFSDSYSVSTHVLFLVSQFSTFE